MTTEPENKIYTYDEVFEASENYFDGDDLAAKVFVDKYALRDLEDNLLELTPKDTHKRISKEFARIEKKYPNPMSEEEIFNLMDHFKYIVPGGSPMSAIGNPYQIQSAGNCFTIAHPFDSYGGICYSDEQLVQLMKRRSGVGINISNLRPSDLPVRNAARTTDGIGLWMEKYSRTCREVAQGGRRGALIEIINIHHPDIELFIDIKKDKTKVTGANVSIQITDDFIEAVNKDDDFELRWPIDSNNPIVKRKIKAKYLWDKIIKSNFEGSEPGMLFWDTAIKNSVSNDYGIVDKKFYDIGCNPCVTGETLILTNKGNVSIKQVIKNDIKRYKVATYNIKTNQIEFEDIIFGGKTRKDTDIIEIELNDGEKIQLTPDHKIYTKNRGYIKATLLNKNDIILKINKKIVERLIKKNTIKNNQDVYDITTEKNHNFFANNILVHNCGEIIQGEDSCRLMSIVLKSFVNNPFTEKAYFDYKKLKEVAYKAQKLMDDLVDIELELMQNIINKINSDPEPLYVKKIERDLWKNMKETCKNGRRTGLGITSIGDVFAYMGVKYGSKESIKITEKIYKSLALAAYKSTVQMAKDRGSFPIYSYEIEKNNIFLNRIWKEDKNLYNEYKKYGRRNVACLTTAPNGSLGILTQSTSGIEPVFQLSYKRRKKINPNDKNSRIDFIDDTGDAWQEFNVEHHGVKIWNKITGKTNIEESPYYQSTVKDIDWMSGIDIQAAAQKWVCHSISRTCNVPNDIKKEDISNIFMRAYEQGCKGLTVYRQGSRSGVLIDNKESSSSKIIKTQAPKRPKSLKCEIFHVSVKKIPFFVIVGLFNNEPYEVFAGMNISDGEIAIPKNIKDGILIKTKRGEYRLNSHENTEEIIRDNISKFIDEDQEASTRLISLALRHGADINFVVHQLEKTTGDMAGFSKAISRVLKKYIENNTIISGEECPDCHGELRRSEGCVSCSCGFTKCM